MTGPKNYSDGPGPSEDQTTVVKTCGCGQSYTASAWSQLEFVGYGQDEDSPLMVQEYRHCPCGSTLIVEQPLSGVLSNHELRLHVLGMSRGLSE